MKQVITFCLIFIYATGGASQGIKPEERDISGKFNGTWLASSHIEKHSRIFSGLRFTCSERKFKITLSIINGWIVALDSKKAEGYIKEDGTFYVNRQIGEWETYFDQTNEQHLVFYGHLGKYRGDGKVVIAYGNSTKGCRGTATLVKTSATYTPGQEPSVFDYYGEAEQEVNTKSYDKNLWAKALVEAEGDELKRKARYIEIRANQLYIQNLGSISKSNLNEQPLPDTDVLDTIILGTYYSKITGIHGLKANKSRITIKQIGNKIVGTNDSKKDNDINGTREGDTIKFKYWTQWREYTGKWKISPDGTRLEGSFEDINGYGGKWILTKIE